MTDVGGTMFASPEMAAIFSGRTMVQRMLDVEAALARAQARAGMIQQQAAAAIGAKCRVELLNLDALFRDAAEAGTPAIPLVRMLTELVDDDARKAVHLGVTSQDIIDTATVLQIREGVDLLIGRLLDIAQACATMAERDRIGEVAAGLGVVAGAMGKIATDIALLAQTEVGEVSTGAAGAGGSGRSSAMPHKRNPVEATTALACSRMAIGTVPVILGA